MVHMIFNQPGDFSEILYYEGDYYSNGTEIIVSDEYINTHTFNGKKIWKYAYFGNKTIYNGRTAYFFWASKRTWLDHRVLGIDYSTYNDYTPYFVVTALELPCMIQEFTKPIKLSEQHKEAVNKAIMDMIEHPKRDWDYPELLIGWIVYIIVMVGCLIFKEFYIPWIIASYIFYEYRKGVLSP